MAACKDDGSILGSAKQLSANLAAEFAIHQCKVDAGLGIFRSVTACGIFRSVTACMIAYKNNLADSVDARPWMKVGLASRIADGQMRFCCAWWDAIV